jgi:preprotein translocase SecF subunit
MKRRFTGKTRIFLAISGAVIAVALILQIFGIGMKMGIDFTGGSLLTYSVGESYNVEDVYKILDKAGYTNYQVTKTEPSEASQKLRADNLAAEATAVAEATATAAADTTAAAEATAAADTTAAADATAVADATAAPEATVEPTATPYAGILNLDKSGIAQDNLTDLQIRLTLVDESTGLEDKIDAAVQGIFAGAKQTKYDSITNVMINENDYDTVYTGGTIVEFETGTEFDSAGIADQITKALTDAGYDVKAVQAIRFDPAAEAAAAAEAEASASAEASAAAEASATAEATAATATPEATVAPEATATPAVVESGTSLRLLVSIVNQTSKVREMIETEMSAKYPNFMFVTIDHVSATAGRDLIANAVKALLIAFACMLVYIAIRFDFYSGVVALGCLLHDVGIMYAFMIFFRGIYQANSAFIAAILTIIGYSINNTIIIFDRVREVSKKPGFTQASKMDVVEYSVGATLSRTINTTLTTLISLVFLYIFGVSSIREFMFPLIVGMLAGVYSSVMLGCQVWAMWIDKMNANKALKGDTKKANKA